MSNKNTNDFTLIRSASVKKILSQNLFSNYKIVREAYLAHESGNTIAPGSFFLHLPENPQARIIALPGYLSEKFQVAGIKWVSSNPKNLAQGLPRASAIIILNNPDTGRPFACLEGSLISAARTAASAVLAAEYMHLNGKKIVNLGIIGNGPIGFEIYKYFIGTSWIIQQVTLFDKDLKTTESFFSRIDDAPNKNIYISKSIESLVSSCDVIVFATTVSVPYLKNLKLIKHCPLMLNISLRDIGSKLILHSNNVVDDISHVLKANTSPHLAEQDCGDIAFINGTLGGLMQNKYKLTANKASIFSPMGLGILDLALAKYVFNKVRISNDEIIINDFF